MSDSGHDQANNLLNKTNRKLQRSYSKAYHEAQKEVAEIVAKFSMTAGMTPTERLAAANKYGRVDRIRDVATQIILEANRRAVASINRTTLKVYKVNYATMANRIQAKTQKELEFHDLNVADMRDEMHTPFKDIAFDNLRNKAALRRELNAAIVRAVSSDGSVQVVMDAIKTVAERSLKSSIRIAETETTRAENLARHEAMYQAKQQGVQIYKRWQTQKDARVRETHRWVEGQTADIHRYFYVKGERMMFPGDPNARPENVVKCRCYMIEIIGDQNK